MGLGLFKLASNLDSSFELQGFQCRFGGSRAAVFAGFAMRIGGTRVSIVGNNVSVDGQLFAGSSHPVGLKVMGSPTQKVSLDSKNNCVHFETNKYQHSWNPGYYHNMNINIAESDVAYNGVCGSSSGRQPLQRTSALFSSSELDSLCQMCGMTNCVRRLDGRRLEMSQPADWVPATNAEDACKLAGISQDVAAGKCQSISDDPTFFQACIYDYCASDGDEALVNNAIESKQREEARAEIFKASTSPSVPTTSLRAGYTPWNSSPTAAQVSLFALSFVSAALLYSSAF